MSKDKIIELKRPEEKSIDALTDILREGAQKLLAAAIEAELTDLLARYKEFKTEAGQQAVVRNGYLPKREIQTGLGDISVRLPKVRDRSGNGIKFNSMLVPPYLKRTKSIEEFLPWLYLKGISTGDFQETLQSLLGPDSPGLSANTISRLKQVWEKEYNDWRKRDLSSKRYVYVWADGIYSNVRMDDRLCILVIIGSDENGRKELIALSDGYRESEAAWSEILTDLRERGLAESPKLAVGDGALGFWKALRKNCPDTKQQRCWVHKTANILEKMPKNVQPKAKEAIHDIWMADTKENAEKAFDRFIKRFEPKYPGASENLKKDRDSLLAFYDFPAEHWIHIRTTNPVESVFATVRQRTHKVKNCGSRTTTLTMAFKLVENAQAKWRRLKGYNLLADVISGVVFKDGIKTEGLLDQKAA